MVTCALIIPDWTIAASVHVAALEEHLEASVGPEYNDARSDQCSL